MSNINDTILEAVEITIDAKLNQMAFDRTIIAEIVNNNESAEGRYQVSYQNSKFYAQSTSATQYSNGQQVYVTITQDGLYLIIGAYSAKNKSPYKYSLPLNRVIQATENFYSGVNVISSLMKEDAVSDIEISSTVIDEELKNLNYNPDGKLKYIALSADFFAMAYNNSGAYGLNLYVNGKIYGKMDSSTFMGNPYAMDGMTEQALFILPEERIESLHLTLYASKEIIQNTAVQAYNIQLYFAYDKEDISKNESAISVYTTNINETLEYANDNRVVDLAARLTRDHLIEPISSKANENNIYWFQYALGYSSPYEETNATIYELEQLVGTNWGYLGQGYLQQITTNKNFASTNIRVCWIKTSAETEKPYIVAQDNIIFNNTQKVVDESSVEAGAAGNSRLSLKINDDNNSNFFVYGHDGAAVGQTNFNIKPYFNDGTAVTSGTVYLYFPRASSQIIVPEENIYKTGEDGKPVKTEGKHKNNNIEWNWRETDEDWIEISTEYEESLPIYEARFNSINFYNSNNTIKCKIIQNLDDTYWTARTLTFGSQDTAGTGYRLNVICQDEIAAFNISEDDPSLRYRIILTDKNGNSLNHLLTTENIAITVSNPSEYLFTISNNLDIENKVFTLTLEKISTNQNQIMAGNYSFLEVSVSNIAVVGEKIKTLKTKMPLAFRRTNTGVDAMRINGATRVIYNNSGNNPTYDKSFYKIETNSTEESFETTWTLSNLINDAPPLAQLIDVNGQKRLSPPSNYNSPNKQGLRIGAQVGGQYVWSQPIIVELESYFSDLVNQWDDSKILIDETNGTILSSFIGAGTKDNDNKFSGVFMGAVSKADTDTTAYGLTGLYGYQDGNLRFKFDENGDAYIGNGEGQYIKFINGDLSIRANEFFLNSDNLLITSTPTLETFNSVFIYKENKDEKPFFQLIPNGESVLANWKISKTNIYRSSESGLEGEQHGVGIYGGESQELPVFWAGWKYRDPPDLNNWTIADKPKFYVTNSGYLVAEKANIGGWEISKSKILESENIKFSSNNSYIKHKEGLTFSLDSPNTAFMCGNTTQGIEITNGDIAYYLDERPIVVVRCGYTYGGGDNSFGLELTNLIIDNNGRLDIGPGSDIYIVDSSGTPKSLRQLLGLN